MKLTDGDLKSRIDEIDLEIINSTFEAIKPSGEAFVEDFYNLLFERYPSVKGMFSDMKMASHAPKMLGALSLVVNSFNDGSFPLEALQELGGRHESYGATKDLYGPVAETMLDVLAEYAGEAWNDDVKAAWSGVLGLVADAMLSNGQLSNGHSNGQSNEEKAAMATNNKERSKGSDAGMAETATDSLDVMMDIMEFSPINIMIADAEENIIFVNKRARDVLTSVEDELATYLPGFKVDEVIGGSIHRYHKSPDTIRNILKTLQPGDKRNGEITPGRFIFEHETRRLVDRNGTHLGFVVQWNDVTAERAKEDQAGRLQKAIDGAQTAMMMIDRDLKVTYANESTMEILVKYEDTLRSLYPNFRSDKLIGSCIDMFHKNPAHQRGLLGNPANLPYETDIVVGPLTFNIRVAAAHDLSGEYVGNVLEWADVTEKRKSDELASQLQKAIDGAQSAMMMIDRDLKVTYANESTMSILNKYSDDLRSLYPSFSADKIVGTCIDIFHKNPAHQRDLLANPANLPYETDIVVGPLIFNIRVAAVRALSGEYVGNVLEWADVTEKRFLEVQSADFAGQIAAIGKSQAVIEFDMEGTILTANENFLKTLNYSLDEIKGKKHSMFVEPEYASSVEYKMFWEKLNRGEYDTGEYKRIGKAGKVVWIQASYNPIMDINGKPCKVVKYATDITMQKDALAQIQKVIDAAGRGELTQRIEAANYTGFLKNLGEGVNSLMNAVVEPIDETTRVIQALAKGDLQEQMEGEFEGQFGTLRDAVNTSITNLQDMVGQILQGATSINTAAAEIAQGNTDLSQRTEEQASSLEETASSMEELTSTVKQNADNAKQANQLATGARTQAEKGGDVVGNAIEAMSAINSSSKKIADIIGVIDEIAFQTNLLALNAAVEAARAGEQGRGFAVVAAEVRNLAQRSAGAAKEIKSLIKDSVEKVDDGSKLVDESGKTLEEIVGAVKKVSDIIAEIAAASQEQSSGIEQVNKAITQMDEVTQQNAALVEEAAAASESLDEQAKGLTTLMQFFKTGESNGGGFAAAPTRAPAAPAARAKKPAPTRQRAAAAKSSSSDDEWEEF